MLNVLNDCMVPAASQVYQVQVRVLWVLSCIFCMQSDAIEVPLETLILYSISNARISVAAVSSKLIMLTYAWYVRDGGGDEDKAWHTIRLGGLHKGRVGGAVDLSASMDIGCTSGRKRREVLPR